METQKIITGTIRPGADLLLGEASALIRGKRIGILTNHTGKFSNGDSLLDGLLESGLAEVVALFGPEHGVSGGVPDGDVVDHEVHSTLGIPIFSLYGKVHKPTAEMLAGVEVLICDIQDVGARFYTFISTIALAMEAVAEQEKFFVVLDRPNPLRGLGWDGPVRTPKLRSFVGWMPIPVTYGLTIDELARLWNGEKWMSGGVTTRLEVVPLEGWRREMWYDETGLAWIPPSPNIPRLSTAIVYPGMCFFEGTSASEGRGTDTPFELIGAPWLEPEKILAEMARHPTPGVTMQREDYVPREIPGVASKPKYEGVECRGIRISVIDRNAVQPVRLGLALLAAMKRCHPGKMVLRHRRFDILTGSSLVRKALERGEEPEAIASGWEAELNDFGSLRSKYLLYKQ